MGNDEKYTILSLDEAIARKEPWQLCYIRPLEKDPWGYDGNGYDGNYPPEFIRGKQEFMAYFTTDVDKVWGDDWNDSLAEASVPYCDAEDGITEILEVPFAVPYWASQIDDDEEYDETDIGACGGDVYMGDWTWSGDSYGTRLNPMFINRCRMPWMTVCQWPARKPGEYIHSRNMHITPFNAGISPARMKELLDGVRTFHEEALRQKRQWENQSDK